MGKGVGADDGFVGLNGHAHRIGYQPAHRVEFLCVDVGIETQLLVLFDHHHHFFEGSIAGAFAQAVDRAFDLAGAAADAGDGIGRRQAEVIVAMAGDDGLIDIVDVVDEEGDLFAVLVREAVAGGIGDIDDGGAGGDDGFDHAGQVFVVGAAGVFGIEFHVIDEVLCPFYGLDGPLPGSLRGWS